MAESRQGKRPFSSVLISLPHYQNPDTRSEIQSLIETGNITELSARLVSRMTFGTAGT